MPDWLLAILVGFVALAVIVPLGAVVLLTAFDVLARIDIGMSRLFWLVLALFIPVGGIALYWLFRPKTYNPIYEKPETAIYHHTGYVRIIPGPAEEPAVLPQQRSDGDRLAA